MLWTKDSDLELFVTLTDRDGEYIDVGQNWISLEVKVGRTLFAADSNPLTDSFTNCYLKLYDGVVGIVVVIPSESLDFGTVYIRSCTHEVNEHYKDGYKDVWCNWMPMDLAIVTEKGINQ